MGFINFLQENFLHVLPVLTAGLVGVVIILERWKALFQTYPIKHPQAFFDAITQHVVAGRVPEAVALCDQQSEKPMARIVKTALLRAHLPHEIIHHGIEMALSEANQSIQRRTSFLAMIANVATLLGLFGTIAGLISAFEAVGAADPQQKSALLAAGISTAMNATMIGLAVAIPCMVAFSFLMNKSNRLAAELEQSGVRILDIIKQYAYAEEFSSEAPSSNGRDHSERKAA